MSASGDENKSCQIICGSAPYLTEKLRAGYVDLAVMLPLSELRLNALAEWTEKMVWVRAAHLQPLDGNEPVPIVHREAGLIDRKVMKLLDEQGVPYRVTFGATDMGTLVAAVEAGMGVLVVPERVALGLPETVVIAEDRICRESRKSAVAFSIRKGSISSAIASWWKRFYPWFGRLTPNQASPHARPPGRNPRSGRCGTRAPIFIGHEFLFASPGAPCNGSLAPAGHGGQKFHVGSRHKNQAWGVQG